MYTGGGITDAVKKMDRGGRDKERSLSCARCIVRAHEQPEEHQIQDEPNQQRWIVRARCAGRGPCKGRANGGASMSKATSARSKRPGR